MEKFDSLKPEDRVTVTIFGPDDAKLFQATNSGYHSIENAINDTLENANLKINPEDCVFEVTNNDSDVSHKYRFNAHGHLKLLLENY